jgi:hypothetical protein
MVELFIQYPKLGVLGLNFTKTGDEMRRQDEDKEKKKQGIKLVISPEVILRKVSPPVLDFALPVCL